MLKKKKLNKLENKIPDITNLATKSELTTLEKKKPDAGRVLLKKQIITLELLRLTLRYQALMVELLKIKMSLLKTYYRIQHWLIYYFWEIQCLMEEMVFKFI